MQNLAYKIDAHSDGPGGSSDNCAACGEPLFGPDSDTGACRARGCFWEVVSQSNVALICAACGEYLQSFFDERE